MIKKIFLTILLLFFSLGGIFLLAKGWQTVTGGFRLDKIEPIFTSELMHTTPDLSYDVEKALDQEYHYFDRGCQTYVFESDDGKYVLKLVRYSKYRLPFWMHYLSLFSKGADAYKNSRIYSREKAFFHSMRSYQYAINDLAKESSALFIHLEKTDLFSKKLTLIDRCKRRYEIDLDHCGFLLQRKVVPLEKALLSKKKEGDLQGSKNLVSSFFVMAETLGKKGLTNRDYNCVKNSGFYDGKVIGMDLGSFYPLKNAHKKSVFEREMRHFSKHFRRWICKKYPDLLDHFDTTLYESIENFDPRFENLDEK